MHRKCILIYIQQDATLHSLFISGKLSFMFISLLFVIIRKRSQYTLIKYVLRRNFLGYISNLRTRIFFLGGWGRSMPFIIRRNVTLMIWQYKKNMKAVNSRVPFWKIRQLYRRLSNNLKKIYTFYVPCPSILQSPSNSGTILTWFIALCCLLYKNDQAHSMLSSRGVIAIFNICVQKKTYNNISTI